LRSLSSTNTTDLHMLLVSPDGTRALDIWSSAGSSASLGNFTLTDSATTELPPTGPLTTGSYLPTNHNTVPDSFAPGPPFPAPQLPASFSKARPFGTSTFESVFPGSAGHGAWSLYVWDGSGQPASISGGWCLDITAGTRVTTTTTVSSSSNPGSFNPPSSTAS